jgi:hypothetical protein
MRKQHTNMKQQDITRLIEGDKQGTLEENREALRYMFASARSRRETHVDGMVHLIWNHKRKVFIITVDDLRDTYLIQEVDKLPAWACLGPLSDDHYKIVMEALGLQKEAE